MRHTSILRLTVSAALLAAAGNLAACGSGTARDVGGTEASCLSCHEMPGAHAAHTVTVFGLFGSTGATADFLPPTATSYVFGCGNCHPLDWTRHGDGQVEVDLSPVGAPPGSLKALNDPAAAYACDPMTGACTCSGVYCHSSGQTTPTYVTTPGWESGESIGCGGCHGNPPRYTTGGAGAGDANSHVGLISERGSTFETGHFAGFPAMIHVDSNLGAVGSHGSPITCQSCHFRTTDAANTGPGGFYYLDTTGDYDLGGTGAFCFGGETPPCATAAYACAGCHDGLNAPTGSGRVMPYFHVNGVRDVDLDPRTGGPGAPLPSRPYFYGPYGANAPTTYWAMGTDAADDPVGKVISFTVQSARWDGATKTCTNVACHFSRTSVRWGEPLTQNAASCDNTCSVCHALAQPEGCP